MRSDDLRFALAAVAKAARAAATVRAHMVTREAVEKKDKSPVTVADFTAQAVVASALANYAPGDILVGEESSKDLASSPLAAKVVELTSQALGASLDLPSTLALIDRGGGDPSADRFWTLDPIDGTKGFLRGEQFAVALALIEGGEVVLGVLGCPNLEHADGTRGILAAATRGGGARVFSLDGTGDGAPMRVTPATDSKDLRFTESVESGHSDQTQSARIAELLGITLPPIRMDSQAKYATVARGDASIYLRLPTRADYQELIWDHAAGTIVIEEAGGRVTDVRGARLDFSKGRRLVANSGVVATNGALHDRVVEVVRNVLGV